MTYGPVNYWTPATYPRDRLRTPYRMPTRTLTIPEPGGTLLVVVPRTRYVVPPRGLRPPRSAPVPYLSGGGATVPAKPSLAATGTATGALVTVSGSTPGSNNTIQVASTQLPGNLAWLDIATFTGDNATSITLPPGTYMAIVSSTLAGIPALPSDPSEFAVTGAVPVVDSPAEIIQALLIANGYGALGGSGGTWPIWASYFPSDADGDLGVCITDTVGTDNGRLMQTAERTLHWGIQVRVRADDHRTGWSKIKDIAEFLDAVQNTPVNVPATGKGYTVVEVTRRGQVVPVGPEPGRPQRRYFTVNATVTFQEGFGP